MKCCQCQGIEEVYSQSYVTRDLSRYRAKGPGKTTRMLVQAIRETGVDGLTLLDIGGGVGAIQHALLDDGVQEVTNVEASNAYIQASRAEAQRRGYSERVSHYHGDFVDLAADIAPADIVTLDRVICCYHEMEKLVSLSAERTGKLYGLVYPRDTWLTKIWVAVDNLISRLRRSPFRAFVHSPEAVEALVSRSGLKRNTYRQTWIWQVVVYTR